MRVFISLLLLGVIGCAKKDPPKSTVKIGNAPPVKSVADKPPEAGSPVELTILDWEGLQQLIASHRGKVVVMDCWSTSCAPCIKEFPKLVALSKKHADGDVACISLSFDYEGIGTPEEQREHVLKFLQEKQATFDNVLSTLDSDALTAKLEIPSIPAVFVYDQEGKLHQRFDNRNASKSGGPFTYEQVEAVVDQLLASKQS